MTCQDQPSHTPLSSRVARGATVELQTRPDEWIVMQIPDSIKLSVALHFVLLALCQVLCFHMCFDGIIGGISAAPAFLYFSVHPVPHHHPAHQELMTCCS